MTKENSPFTVAALILCFLSLFSITSVFMPLVFGSLSIIFAVLAKEQNPSIQKKNRLAMIISITSIILSFVLIIGLIYLLFFNQEYRNYSNKLYEETYGYSFDEYLDMLKDIISGNTDEDTMETFEKFMGISSDSFDTNNIIENININENIENYNGNTRIIKYDSL